MADNYLEKRYDEVFGSGKSFPKSHPSRPSLDTLLLKNRSYRGFVKDYKVHQLQLDAILSVNTRIASGMNAQRLRFRAVNGGDDAVAVMKELTLGAALKELSLPLPGTEPETFIIVCATCEESPIIDIDLGISLQSMLLKAVELGLGGVIVRNFNKDSLRDVLGLPYDPIAVLAIGKPAEKVELVPVKAGDNLNYYRQDGTHYVPKLVMEDLMI